MPSFLKRHFGGEKRLRERLVGTAREIDSGYYDIVRFFGPDALDPAQVDIEYRSEPFSFSDARIREYAREIEDEFRRKGRIYDGPTIMHLDRFDTQSSPPRMVVREATYGDHCGSCLALDWPHAFFENHGGTLREYYRRTGGSPDKPEWPLASCLGTCGLLVTRIADKVSVLAVTRSARLASLENTVGVSAAGTVDWNTGYSTLLDLLLHALGQEIEEELNLAPTEYTINPLAFAREIFRGERPQLFALISTGLSPEEVQSRLKAMPPDNKEFTGFQFYSLDTPPADLNHEARMNWMLAEEFLYQ